MIHFTHNDLDALGSMLCVDAKYGDKITKVYHTYYGDFEKQVNDVIADKDDIVIITDLSFAERPDCLHKLIQNKKYVQLIDHHSYPENFWLEFSKYSNFKRIINDQICAALICHDTLLPGVITENNRVLIGNLCKVIDVYDCWREDDKLFEGSQRLNLWFWTKNIDELCKAIRDNGYKLPSNSKEEMVKLYNDQQKEIENAYNNKQVFRMGPVTFVFNNYVFNPILIKELKEGQKLVVCCFQFRNGDFCFKVRVKQGIFNSCSLNLLRMNIMGKITGHPNAFSYVKKISNEVELTNEYKMIVNEFVKILNNPIHSDEADEIPF